jgi:GH15 family glucan-1,4-alpha-glucosidase
MRLEDPALIGNCQVSALIERSGAMVWSCLPRFDSEPIFGRLLDAEGGHFTVGAADGKPGAQGYLGHRNVLETRFATEGGSCRVLDLARSSSSTRAGSGRPS